MDREFTGQAGDRKDPQLPPLRRGAQQVPLALPGVPAAPRQRRHAAAVDELQARRVKR
jgi:hypothetical protein